MRTSLAPFLAACFFLIIFIPDLPAQTRTRRMVNCTYYPGGQLQRETRIKVTMNRYMEPRRYYKRTVTYVNEYYESGSIKYKKHEIRQLGEGWRPYYELLNDEKQFNEKGILQTSRVSRCDRSRVICKTYSSEGALLYTSVAVPW